MVAVFLAAGPVEEAAEAGKIHAFASENLLHKGGMRMELWVAGIALLIIATGILVLILCREKIHKGLRIAVVCVLGVLFVAVLGWIFLKERLTGRKAAGMALIIAGILLIQVTQ